MIAKQQTLPVEIDLEYFFSLFSELFLLSFDILREFSSKMYINAKEL